jgi:hypothetical protein
MKGTIRVIIYDVAIVEFNNEPYQSVNLKYVVPEHSLIICNSSLRNKNNLLYYL